MICEVNAEIPTKNIRRRTPSSSNDAEKRWQRCMGRGRGREVRENKIISINFPFPINFILFIRTVHYVQYVPENGTGTTLSRVEYGTYYWKILRSGKL